MAYSYGLSFQLGIVALFDRGIESVHVYMYDFAVGTHVDITLFHANLMKVFWAIIKSFVLLCCIE